jgi:hypothetical protein
VELYADYEPRLLLPFLRSSHHYSLDKAYDVCTKRGLTRERVFILGRMGNSREALALIVNKLQDMQQVQKLQLSETFNGCTASKSPPVVCLKDIFKGTGCPNHCPLCRTCYAFGIDACLLRAG